jgi:hypothetical protein
MRFRNVSLSFRNASGMFSDSRNNSAMIALPLPDS